MGKIGCFFKIIICYFIYLFLGMAALYAIAMCSAIIIALPLAHDPIETFKELFGMEEAEFIAFVRGTFLEKLPLGNLVASACENVNIHIGIIPGVQEVGNMNLVDFLLDCVTATIAGTIAYFFNRVNVFLSSIFQGFIYSLVLGIVLTMWSFVAYCIAATLICLVDSIFPLSASYIVKITIFAVCILIHSAAIADKSGKLMFIKAPLRVLTIELVKNLFVSMFMAWICYNLRGLYDISHFGGLLLSVVACALIFLIKNFIEKQKDYRLGLI